ncbi:MAG: hypothetical protein M1833_000907 [Piccolia ochrophora]|nr:MAG: hypothetical protein M1833_000907 [Piccolia ochrophora]
MADATQTGQNGQMASPASPPYPPQNASLGGVPTVKVDVPITAIFLVLFICGAVAHMTILQVNLKRGHKFIMSGLIFGFCMARITTCVLRIAWSTHPTHTPLAIAAQIFVSAGVVLLFIVNLIFTQRIIRATHPRVGWHRIGNNLLLAYYSSIVITLIMLITCTVQSFYTLNRNTRRIDRDVQLYGQTWFTIAAFLPLPLIFAALVVPRQTRVEKFGSGRWRSKIVILLTAAVLLTLGSAFRAGTNYRTPRPRADPAWYHSKACFYIFNFVVEILVVALYAVVRVDLRFHVPNGAKGPGDYVAKPTSAFRVRSEEEVFDDKPVDEPRTDEETGRLPPVSSVEPGQEG